MTEVPSLILGIDDNHTNRFLLDKLITRVMNYRIEMWTDSIDFDEKVNGLKEIPQLVIMDIKVYPMNGFEMLKRLRENDAFRDTVIVAFTGNVMPDQIEELKDAGFDGLISKPIDRQAFPKMIDSMLAGESIWHVS